MRIPTPRTFTTAMGTERPWPPFIGLPRTPSNHGHLTLDLGTGCRKASDLWRHSPEAN